MTWIFLALLPQEETKIEADYLSSWEEPAATAFYLQRPTVEKGTVRIRADHMILWAPKGGDTKGFRELYAEGNIVYRRDGKELKAERMYYDAAADKAYLIHVKGRGREAKYDVPLHFSADTVRMTGPGRFQAEELSISTCDYGVPHYDVYVGSGSIVGREPRPKTGPFDLFPYQQWTLEAETLVPRIRKVPIFYLPAFALPSELFANFPLRSIRAGRTSRFGYFVLTDWGLNISKGTIDKIVPWENATPEDDHQRWGQLLWELDWRRERGWAWGVDLEWNWKPYFGYVDTYFLHDQGRAGTDFDDKFPPLERPERGRARAFHRHDFAEDWRYELEASWLSDAFLLEEFFPKEFKEGKEQETTAYVRWLGGHAGAFAQERHRLNDFQTQIEYLPRAKFFLLDHPILPALWERILFTHVTEIAHQRFLFPDDDPGEDERMWRFDTLNEIAVPIDFRILQIAPFGSWRGTLFEDDLEGESEFRSILTAGVRARVDFHAIHDVEWEAVGLRKLRHIVQLEIRAAHNLFSSEDNREIFRFDETDRIDEFAEFTFLLRNRLQTKAYVDGTLQTWEFFTLALGIEYYPDSRRDTTAFNENNFLPPFHWITLAGPFGERHWSNLHWEFDLRPRKYFVLSGRGEYNPEDTREEVRELSVTVQPLEELTVSVGNTFLRDVTNAVSFGLEWRLAEKWYVSARAQYDYEADEFTSQRLILGRDFHDFILEGVFENDPGRDERKVYVTFVPKFLGRKIGSSDLERYRR